MHRYWLSVGLAAAALTFGAPGAPAQDGPVYRVPVTGVIELGLAPYVARVLRQAEAASARAVILDLDTPGGRVDAAQQIVKAIIDAQVPVYALVNSHAWSAGAMIALAADSIFMVPGSSIGAATPVSGEGAKAPEKIVSAMRGEFRALAERRGLDPRLAEAMVDEEIEIAGVVEKGRLLTLTGREARDLGLSAGEVTGLDSLLATVGAAQREVVSPRINWAEQLVRFLSHPVVAPLLLSVGVLGIMIELRTPAFGVAGVTGLLALTAFFGSHYIVGLAGNESLILLVVGLVALGVEVFLVPGFGVAGIVALLCIGAAIFLALIGSLPTWADIARASGIMAVTVGIVALAAATILQYLPARARWRGIFLREATGKAAGYVSAPIRSELVGAEGVTVTDLRPSGVVQVGDLRVDVVAESGFIARGARVRVISAEGYRHVVRELA